MNRRNTILLLAILLLIIGKANAQTFWFENWTGTTCAKLCTTYSGPNGTWTTVATGANGASANEWYYSYTEQGMGRGQCGSAAGTKATAHIGNVSSSPAAFLFCPAGDCGAAYDASSGADNTNTEIESPVINCTGKTGITLSFNYIMGGQAGADYASVNYYNGTVWALLVNPPMTTTCTGGQGKWAYYSIALPASANNNANVQIAFNWQNNADNSGNDPSFAVDSIQLSVTVPTKPVANFVASDSTICVGDTVYFTDKSTNSPTSWKWTFTGGTPPTSIIQNPKVVYTTPGAFTVKLVVKNGSGSDSLTKISYINVVAKPTVTLSGNTTICPGSSTVITATGGGTYAWSPATNLTCTNCPNPTASPAATTTYSLAVSNGTCVKDTTVTITVNPTPTVSVSPSSATICTSGGGTILTASGATTYTWKPATGLTCTNCTTTTANPATTTTYTLIGASAAGCKDSVTVVVTVASSITAVITGKDSVCKGSSTTLTASGGATYTWAPATGLSATNTAVVTATPATTTTYTVIATSGSCSAKDSVVVKVDPLPVVTLTAAPSLSICNGSSATLTAAGGSTYLWSTTATTSGITVSPATTTTYSVTVKNTSGCQVDTSMTVTVNPIPTVTVSPASASICTGGGGASLTAGGASTYTWKPATGLSCTNCSITNANPASTTTYTVVGTSVAGCKDSTTVTITVTGSISVTISGKDSVCAGGFTTITTSGGTTYAWSPGTGLNCTNCSVTTITPASTTTYTISVTNASGCNKDTTLVITVVPIPVVTVTPANPAICKGNNVSLTASGATTYAWSPSAGLTCTNCIN
ncbi:MAG TPA: PKD domain-containing protein, partial [Bacteroidia bacterium]|nr:PKD domain-containing protein [Bacteroidia bacterium]